MVDMIFKKYAGRHNNPQERVHTRIVLLLIIFHFSNTRLTKIITDYNHCDRGLSLQFTLPIIIYLVSALGVLLVYVSFSCCKWP